MNERMRRHFAASNVFARQAAGGVVGMALGATLLTGIAPAQAATSTSASPTVATAPAPQAGAFAQGRIAGGGTRFSAGQRLAVNQYRFIFQSDGNAVVYGNGRALWAIRTHGLAKGGRMIMQGDGNLVIYSKTGRPIWSSRTHGIAAGGRLVLQSDGHLVIYASSGKAVWSNRRAGANTLTPGAVLGPGHYIQAHGSRARLIMHASGTLEQVSSSGKSMWRRNFPAGSKVKMWADGSLAAYAPSGQRVWRAPGAGSRGARTVIERDNRLVTYSSTGTKVVTPTSALLSTLSSPHAAAVFNQLNAERARNGVHTLRFNSKLAAAARGHNLAMAKADQLSHRTGGEADLTGRINATGYRFSTAAENVGMNPDTSIAGALQLESIMYNQKAPHDGHRRNILSRNYTEVGIDVQVVGGKLWLTQNFAHPR